MTAEAAPWPHVAGEMAERVRTFAWAGTPMGASASWSPALRTAVEFMLASPELASLAVGAQRTFLYNDAAAKHYGAQHPAALGRPLPAAFPGEFERVASVYDRVFAGESLRVPAQPLDLTYSGTEDVFDAYLTPVRDADGVVIAAHMAGFAASEQRRAEARLRESEAGLAAELRGTELLRDLAERLVPEENSRTFYAEILSAAMTITRSDGGTIQLYEPETGSLVLLVTHGFGRDITDPFHRVDADSRTACGLALRTNQRTFIDFDAETDEACRMHVEAGYRSAQATPLLSREGTPLGMLNTHWSRAHHRPNERELRFLDLLARQAADLIEARQAHEALRESDERQAFLLELSDALRPLTEEGEIERTATRLLGEHLQADRCFLSPVYEDGLGMCVREEYLRGGASSVLGDYTFAQFGDFVGPELHAGHILSVEDVDALAGLSPEERKSYAVTGIGAYLLIPLVRDGRLAAFLTINHQTPRRWSDADKAVARQTADRLWTARERGRVEAALREREAQFRTMSDNIAQLAWTCDRLGDVTWYNQRWLDYTGLSFDEMRHWGWRKVQHPDHAERVVESVTRARDGGERWEDTFPLRRHDGVYRWFQSTAVPIRDAEGEIVRWFGTNTDITEELEVTAALRESEARLRQFGEASQDVLWIRDAETLQWTYLTPAFETIYGLSREEALGGENYRNWADLIVPEDRDHALAAIERVRAGEQVAFGFRIRRPDDGAIRWLRNTDFPITDERGKVTLIGGIGSDITDLREAEQRLQALIAGIPQLVWRAVDGGHWTWASPQWTEFTGQAEVDSHREGWLAVVHPDDRERTREVWAGAADRGEFHADYRICHAGDGRYRWFQTRATPVRDAAGAVTEWLGTSTDIDDLRELQERQHVLVAELQHRTRNLMGVVRSTANRTGEASVDLADFQHRFRDRLEALARVQGLLSRLNETDRIDFDELIRSEINAMNGADERVMLRGPTGIRLRSSVVQTLAMALHELATNAVKYGALSQPAASVSITWRMVEPDRRGRPRLHIDWRESGVVMPILGAAPQGGGQGRELIEEALPYQLDAETTFELGPDGVHCTIIMPVSASNLVEPTHA